MVLKVCKRCNKLEDHLTGDRYCYNCEIDIINASIAALDDMDLEDDGEWI